MSPLAKKLLLPFVCLLFLGCSTPSDIPPIKSGDLDWARAIADGVVADLYGEDLVMFAVAATYLDISGFLYDGAQHPWWRFSYIGYEGLYVRVIVHPHGSTTVTEGAGSFTSEIMFTYTSADVRDWLDLARYCYRLVTGREDDACYGLEAFCSEYGSEARIELYDAAFDPLARAVIDMSVGTLISFELY
ncbi:MAG TPA: hypothetical protein ENN88_03430 [Candidatus Coatesbacteria bacterium]|nr:hypothetical protein [Candidatus Coatesbacteria bacterium]